MARSAPKTPAQRARIKRKAGILKRRRPGAPSKYIAAKHPIEATRYALLGMVDVEIADQFEITISTFYKWKIDHPEFSDALMAGKAQADARAAETLYKRAMGESATPAVKVSFDKDGNPLYAPYVERHAPDVTALKFWLLNRQPGRWKERREVEMTVTLEQQIAQLTPQERHQRLLELQAKAAGMLIEGEATDVTPDE